MRPRRPRVATITVGTTESRWLETGLGSLVASDTEGLELIVHYVDNASRDGSPTFVQERFPAARLTQNPKNFGFARANNIGMATALTEGADYIFLVNPDTRTPQGLIRDLVRFMESWPDYAIIGPMQYEYDGSTSLDEYNEWSTVALRVGERHAFAGDWPDHPSLASPLEGRAPNTLEHPYVQGSALFARADALRMIGLFDEVYHTYYEEVDLCRRARWAGYRVALALDLGIQHKGGGGAGHGRYRRVQMRRNRYYCLFTDVDWKLSATARLAAKWLRRDLRGQSVGGTTNPLIGTAETALAACWLAFRMPQIAGRRRRYRRLRRIAEPRLPRAATGDAALPEPRPTAD
jgi:GT2 family glycosyltransferase